MSMDEQFWQLKQFQAELENFNENLKASWKEVEAKYDHLSPLWQDEYRRRHDQAWEPLQAEMKRYLTKQGSAYVEFLSSKSQALERYLRGG